MGTPVKPFSSEFNQLALSVGLSKNDIKEIKTVPDGIRDHEPFLFSPTRPCSTDHSLNSATSRAQSSPEEKQKRSTGCSRSRKSTITTKYPFEGIRSSMEF
jgi:hypothetical protein